MKLIGAAFCMAAICAVGAGAQTQETKTKTKVEVKDGKDITITGCVEPNPGGGYMLTNARGGMRYMLVTDDNLSKHIGHLVEIKGKAADRGDGKVKIESKSKTEVEHGKDTETHAKTEVSGDMPGMQYLGVKSVKMLSASCP
jgi:hypothetical protein